MPGAGEERFLVVEDDPNVLTLLERALAAPNRAVDVCASAGAALKAFDEAAAAVTLVITDVVLPDLSGPDMLRLMLVTRPDLRAVFVTGYSDEMIEVYLGGLTFQVLHKPFTVVRLREVVSAALETGG